MTAPRGPQRSEDRSDLTPAEARAEIEAFFGPDWEASAWGENVHWAEAAYRPDKNVDGPDLSCGRDTYRAAVDALKQAWRDAVRPWCMEAVHGAGTHAAEIASHYLDKPHGNFEGDTAEAAIINDLHDPDDPDTLRIIARVLKEDDK